MDPLPGPLTTFRQLIEADLRRAARLIIEVRDEIDLQLRIATPEGDHHLPLTLPDDPAERARMLSLVGRLMAVKQAVAFVLAAELAEPDGVHAIGVGPREIAACIARIRRHPRPWTTASFGPVEWLDRDAVDPAIMALLPRGRTAVSAAELAELRTWFGPAGRFPLVHVATGELRQL